MIGSVECNNRVFLAPMAGVTDLPFRLLVREFGCALCFTEMVSAQGLLRGTAKTYRYLDSTAVDHPLGVQIFGFDPDAMAAAARIVAEKGADLVDINMGCPVRKVIKTGAGAALMRNPTLAARIVSRVKEVTGCPVTVKMRAGWSPSQVNAVDIALAAEDAGADAVIVHPRTAVQGYSGEADWEMIRRVKDAVAVPVVGSGDIRRPEDAVTMMTMTGCDAVMIGRGALGNPWLIDGTCRLIEGKPVRAVPSLDERFSIVLKHLDLCCTYYGDIVGIRVFRKHLLWYTKGLPQGACFRRNAVAVVSRQDIRNMLGDYFSQIDAVSILHS